jgi:hypothetical protein
MSYITTSGYGYRKRTCEDVTSWFLNKFFPRHKITVDIVHRGLKRESVYGYCDVVGETYRPRDFLIEMDTWMNEEMYIKTLLHELVHLRQWVVGSLRQKRGKMYYGKECVEDIEYWYQPHEIEAREQEETLYVEYIKEVKGTYVDDTVTFTFFTRPRHLL